MTLQFYTLGRFELYIDGVPVASHVWADPQVRTLCEILLTFRGRPVAKRQLQSWLWPDIAPDVTERSLSSLASRLSRVLDAGTGAAIVDQGASLTLPVEAVAVDTDLLYLAAALNTEMEGAIAALEAADDLYQGAYLPSSADAPWATSEAQRVTVAYETILLKLADAYARQGQYSVATLACQSLLLFNPLSVAGTTRLTRYRQRLDESARD